MFTQRYSSETHLTIIGGNGDGVEELQKFIIEAELSSNITLLIDADNETKIQMYQEADLYFQPSTYEGFGNSVLEAMTMERLQSCQG